MKHQVAVYRADGSNCGAQTSDKPLEQIISEMDAVLVKAKEVGKFESYMIVACADVGLLKDVPQSPAVYNSKKGN
jgi:hypothetical protein